MEQSRKKNAAKGGDGDAGGAEGGEGVDGGEDEEESGGDGDGDVAEAASEEERVAEMLAASPALLTAVNAALQAHSNVDCPPEDKAKIFMHGFMMAAATIVAAKVLPPTLRFACCNVVLARNSRAQRDFTPCVHGAGRA